MLHHAWADGGCAAQPAKTSDERSSGARPVTCPSQAAPLEETVSLTTRFMLAFAAAIVVGLVVGVVTSAPVAIFVGGAAGYFLGMILSFELIGGED